LYSGKKRNMATTYDVIIVNGIVVTDTDVGEYDIAIKDEKIARVVKRGELKDAQAEKTIDAEGGYVMVRWSDVLSELR
jgi:dihydropyrimidinase